MQQQMYVANSTIAQLQAQHLALQQQLLDAEAVRQSEVERAFQDGELAASKPRRRTESTSLGATTLQQCSIASPPASMAGTALPSALPAMIADAVSTAMTKAIGSLVSGSIASRAEAAPPTAAEGVPNGGLEPVAAGPAEQDR